MVNFVSSIAIGVGIFIIFWLTTDSVGTAFGIAVAGVLISMIAFSFYNKQRNDKIRKNEDVPLEKERTPENVKNPGYNPDSDKKQSIDDPTK